MTNVTTNVRRKQDCNEQKTRLNEKQDAMKTYISKTYFWDSLIRSPWKCSQLQDLYVCK